MEESTLAKLRRKNNKHLKSFSENNLSDNEKILSALDGYIGKISGKDDEKHYTGLLLCTNNVVAFHSKGLFSNVSRSIPIKNISSIDIDKKILIAKIAFHTSGDKIIFNSYDSLTELKNFKLLVEKIRDTDKTPKSSEITEDPIDTIRRLSQLKDDGIISEEEFEEKKKTLLNEI